MKMRYMFFMMVVVAALPSALYSAQKNRKKNKQNEAPAQVQPDLITAAVIAQVVQPPAEITAPSSVNIVEQEIKTLSHAPSSTRLTSENSISSMDSFAQSQQHAHKEYSQSQSQSSSSSGTWGTWVDTVYTKSKDLLLGHEANVLDDIKAGRLQCDTDGLHRIDRAIDGYITAHNFRGVHDLLHICLDKQIMINPSHLDKAQAFIKQGQQELMMTLALVHEQKKKIQEKAAYSDGIISHSNTEFIENHL